MHGAYAGEAAVIVRNALALMLGAALMSPVAVAQAPAPETAAATPAPRVFASEHVARIADRNLRYTAAVEEFVLADPDGTPQASIFTTSYVARTAPGSGERPVIFVFNGGPGSSSVWLHLGFAGPRRLVLPDPVNPPTTPPFALTDNEESPLDVADIVMIDPPGTGFSTILPGGRPEQFYGVQQDAAAMVRLIEAWIQRHDRWNAPRYLLSESYGTIRAAVVARLMAGGPMETGRMTGLPLSGVILLGQAMAADPGGDMAAAMALPSLAATACHFGKVASPCDVAQHVQKAREFAAGPYLTALYQGSALREAERSAVANSLASLTGLAPQTILASDLKVTPAQFARTLLASDNRQIGLYDARFTLPLAPNGNDPVADDPAMGQYVPAFVGGLNGYMRRDLKVALDQPYEAIAFRTVNARWDYGMGPGIPSRRNFGEDLGIAMRRNPGMRLMVGTGYFDLVTTLGAAEHVIRHSGIPLSATRFTYYRSGHMPYLGDETRLELARDVRAFVRGSEGQ